MQLTLTSLESDARGHGTPEVIIATCLKAVQEFYNADSAALVETNTELGYGICVGEDYREGVPSFVDKIIGISPEETPFLFDRLMSLEIFDVNLDEDNPGMSSNKYNILKRLSPIFPDNLVISDKVGNYYINPNINVTTDAGVFESFFCKGTLSP